MIYFLTVNYYSSHLIAKLVDSLPTNEELVYKTVIINNSSDDKQIDKLESESIFIIDANENLGFGSACNLGIQWIYTQDAQAIIWIINPDAYLLTNPLDKVELFFTSHPEVSILGTIIETPTGEVWFAGGRFAAATGSITTPDLLTKTDAEYTVCDWVSGCSMLLNLRNFSEYPKFDSKYFLYYEDFDFCRRYANQGHLIAVTNQFGVLHQPSSITNKYPFRKIQHSTYSYLLTLEKYTNTLVVMLRLMRLLLNAFALIAIKPKVAFGKLSGILIYWNRSLF